MRTHCCESQVPALCLGLIPSRGLGLPRPSLFLSACLYLFLSFNFSFFLILFCLFLFMGLSSPFPCLGFCLSTVHPEPGSWLLLPQGCHPLLSCSFSLQGATQGCPGGSEKVAWVLTSIQASAAHLTSTLGPAPSSVSGPSPWQPTRARAVHLCRDVDTRDSMKVWQIWHFVPFMDVVTFYSCPPAPAPGSNVASDSPLSFCLIPTRNGPGQPSVSRRLKVGHTHAPINTQVSLLNCLNLVANFPHAIKSSFPVQ